MLTFLNLLLGDLPTNLIRRVWDAVKSNNLELTKELNIKYRDRAEAEAKLVTQTNKFGQRGFREKKMYEELPYHKTINMAIIWAAACFHLEIVDYLLNEDAINFK